MKTPVIALIERDGRARTQVVESVNAKSLKTAIVDNVNQQATIMTDELGSYKGIGKSFVGGHQTVKALQGMEGKRLAYKVP